MARVLVKQAANSWNCLACVAAMLVGCEIEDVHAWLGNDVGDPMHDAEFVVWAIKNGWWPCMSFSWERTGDDGCVKGMQLSEDRARLVSVWDFKAISTAYVAVVSPSDRRYAHAVLWADGRVYDPSPAASDTEGLTDYEIVAVTGLAFDNEGFFHENTRRITNVGQRVQDLSPADQEWWAKKRRADKLVRLQFEDWERQMAERAELD